MPPRDTLFASAIAIQSVVLLYLVLEVRSFRTDYPKQTPEMRQARVEHLNERKAIFARHREATRRLEGRLTRRIGEMQEDAAPNQTDEPKGSAPPAMTTSSSLPHTLPIELLPDIFIHYLIATEFKGWTTLLLLSKACHAELLNNPAIILVHSLTSTAVSFPRSTSSSNDAIPSGQTVNKLSGGS
ncbi:hypothetical protein HK097_008239 [Rhizophlyctis rosea]|uniref:Uncharacterized protein n=1 Tax=Rhizophlyctis rosea TaxID=64517 RepID=A0AAD5X5E6_9FUNG|nr:hypothetical protein HK097_008239 [Rhizophlyctis rosea]